MFTYLKIKGFHIMQIRFQTGSISKLLIGSIACAVLLSACGGGGSSTSSSSSNNNNNVSSVSGVKLPSKVSVANTN